MIEFSEYASNIGVIIEGWLEKKSKRTGMWIKRFYVLIESTRDFCVLRSFSKTAVTAWGEVPLTLNSEFKLNMIKCISTKANRSDNPNGKYS